MDVDGRVFTLFTVCFCMSGYNSAVDLLSCIYPFLGPKPYYYFGTPTGCCLENSSCDILYDSQHIIFFDALSYSANSSLGIVLLAHILLLDGCVCSFALEGCHLSATLTRAH